MISSSRALFTVAALLALGACGDEPSAPQYHTLSSTVAGLKASGLVLAVNDAYLTVLANTSGSFSQKLSASLTSGTAYSVSVVTQPAGQTCSVAGGSGTIGSADVANVVVTCADQSFSLGGSVSGLSVSGLVLANGADSSTVAQGATTFAFPSAVAYSSAYDVEVQSQPPGLACAVSGGSGAMPAGDVNTILVTCTDQLFTVGGTIANSPGITLVNGGDTLQVPSSSGSTPFTMEQGVPFGSSYNITAQGVPVGQTCTVTNGSRIMGPANVTDVTVSCASQGFTVGGSLSGLSAGETLVIANSNGEHATIDPTKSSYTLSTLVAYGASYSLNVVTQPSGKTCMIANSSRINVTANASDANITCAVTTHTVGGSISGLHGATGLILRNNGGDSTTINANATTFTMTTGVPENSSYNISVSTQPTPASVSSATASTDCTVVSGGMGPVGTSNITSVAINCSNTLKFATKGGPYSWTVPSGVSSIDVIATGGGGGGGGGSGPPDGSNSFAAAGGAGGRVAATLVVNGGDAFTLVVGGGGTGGAVGSPGFGGGGAGGGSSNINAGTANQIIAGGGGGAGGVSDGIGGDGSGGSGQGNAPGQGGAAGLGGAGGSFFGQAAPSGGDGDGGPGADGGGNGGSNQTPGGVHGFGAGSGQGGAGKGMGQVSGGGGGGYGGGGGGTADSGGGGGGSTGPSGAIVGVSSGGAEGGAAGAAGSNAAHTGGGTGADGVIQISY